MSEQSQTTLGPATTADIMPLGVVDGNGVMDKFGPYLMLDVSEKTGRQYRLRISLGSAEILQSEIAGMIAL